MGRGDQQMCAFIQHSNEIAICILKKYSGVFANSMKKTGNTGIAQQGLCGRVCSLENENETFCGIMACLLHKK